MAKRQKSRPSKRSAVSRAAQVTSLSEVVEDDSGVAASQLPPGYRVPRLPGTYCCMLAHLANTRVYRSREIDDTIKRCLMPFTAVPWSLDSRLDESIGGLAAVLRGAGFTTQRVKTLILEYVVDNIDEALASQAAEHATALWQRVYGVLQNRLKSDMDAMGANPFALHMFSLQQSATLGAFADGRAYQAMPPPGYGVPGVAPRADGSGAAAAPAPAPSAAPAPAPAPSAAPTAAAPREKKTVLQRAKDSAGDAAISAVVGAATSGKGKRVSGAVKAALGTIGAEVAAGEVAESLDEATSSEEKKSP